MPAVHHSHLILTPCGCLRARHLVLKHIYTFFSFCLCALSFSAAQWNQLCVCLLYLVNLLQESRLQAAVPSLHIFSGWPTSSPGELHVCSKYADTGFTDRSLSVEACLYGLVFTMSTFVPSLSSSFWPVVCVDSTCAYLLVYLLQESGLPAGEQSHNISPVRGKAGWETETRCHCLSGRHVFVIPSMAHQSGKTQYCLFCFFISLLDLELGLEKKK